VADPGNLKRFTLRSDLSDLSDFGMFCFFQVLREQIEAKNVLERRKDTSETFIRIE
jgi:hypothetical protein